MLRRLKRGCTVLYYHGIVHEIIEPRVQHLQFPMRLFEKQIDYLQKHYQIIALRDIPTLIETEPSMLRRAVVLTFDDGYRSVLTGASPFLESRGIPYSVFVSTKYVDQEKRFPSYTWRVLIVHARTPEISILTLKLKLDTSSDAAKDRSIQIMSRYLRTLQPQIIREATEEAEQKISAAEWEELNNRHSSEAPLTWKDLRRLRDRGVGIGSHGHDHISYGEDGFQPYHEEQIAMSKRLIEREIGACDTFAYPYGQRNDIGISAVRSLNKQGFKMALSTMVGEIQQNTDLLLMPRLSGENSLCLFKLKTDMTFMKNRSYVSWSRSFNSANNAANN